MFVICYFRNSMTGFSHVAMHDKVESDTKEEWRERDEAVCHARGPSRREISNDRQEHYSAACPHPVLHKLFRSGLRSLFVIHNIITRFFGHQRGLATGFQPGNVNVTNRYKNHCYVSKTCLTLQRGKVVYALRIG